ncbi:MAG: putative glycoside hydrolase [Candidatus Magasanikbacteria bacterium]
MNKNFYRTIVAIFFGLFVSVFCYFNFFAKSAPILANYYLRWDIPSSELENLAKWDLIIIDMENQVSNPDKIRRIRQLNPNIKILAYVTSQEIKSGTMGTMRTKLKNGISDSWYLRRSNGDKMSYWPGTTMLNPTNLCPLSGGQRWNDYLASFMTNEVLSTGLWDGIFYDNAWGDLTWFSGSDVDLNFDGQPDSDINKNWNTGMTRIFNLTRDLSGAKYVIVGNAMTREYANDLNGMMYENFQNHVWRDVMYAIRTEMNGNLKPRIIIINGNTNNTGNKQDYQTMRYGLGSALVGGAYYSFDYGDQNHEQTWWYDEYDVELGNPTGEARTNSGGTQVKEDVWRRDFENGIALVNSTGNTQTVNLGEDYEKIIGKQDPSTNDGSIVDKVSLNARDGLVLRKVTQNLFDVPFKNGNLVTFYNIRGQRARNGFFAFVSDVAGGARVFVGDLNGDGNNEKIVGNSGRVQIFNSTNQNWFDSYPFGGSNTREIRFSVGESANGEIKILVTPTVGNRGELYNYHGGMIKEDFYPFGTKYNAGFYGALGNFSGGFDLEAVIGSGGGRVGEVLIFDANLQKIKYRFFPYDKKFTGKVKVAAGDVDGDGKAEIITLAKVGTKNIVRIFDNKGKKLSEFSVISPLGGGDLNIGATDVNFDGKDEVVVDGG